MFFDMSETFYYYTRFDMTHTYSNGMEQQWCAIKKIYNVGI